MVAALTAAHQGLSTVVVEKAAHYGGSTARSGGGVWIPNNEILQRDGVNDTTEAARTYLHSIIGDVVPAERIDTYLERGPEMLSFVLEELPAEDVLGAGLLRLLPGGAGRPRRWTFGRAEAVQRQQARRRPARPRAAVRQGAAEYGRDAAGLRAAQPAQAPPTRRAAQPQGRRARDDVGQGHRQEPGRHGSRADRPAAHRSAAGRGSRPAEHRADRSVRRGRRGPRHLRPRHQRTGIC